MVETTVYKIKFPIGDWSGDGHEQYDDFVFESNKPVEDVREAHFKIKDVFGFDPGGFAADYQDNIIPYAYKEALIEKGFEEFDELTPEVMADIWAFMLMGADDTLKLNRIVEEHIPMIVFYGFDEQGRHIPGAGYGLYEAW